MNGDLLPKITAQGTVALLLFLAVATLARAAGRPLRGWRPSVLLLLAGLVAGGVRIYGLTAAGWWSGVVPGLSFPTLALLVHASLRASGHEGLFRDRDLRGLWAFGCVAGWILYPAAMGWGPWDPYAAGWSRSWLSVAAGLVCFLTLLQGHRLGWVLFAAAAGWRLGLLESHNYWDYLVDPVLVVVTLVLGGWTGLQWFRLRGRAITN